MTVTDLHSPYYWRLVWEGMVYDKTATWKYCGTIDEQVNYIAITITVPTQQYGAILFVDAIQLTPAS